MTALERAQESKRHQDIKVENLPVATRKWFRRIYRLEPHTSLSWRRTNLIKDIFGSLTVDAIMFIYNAGYDAGRKARKGGEASCK